jgi:transposase
MAQNFIACDREQELLLPPSLREWLPPDHLAWFVLDAVEAMDLSGFLAGYRDDGWGRAAHDPAMMVALLVYAYAIGERSSRRIERRCHEDVAVRVITANQAPDHTTVARFRQRHETSLSALFGDVLELCAEAGLVHVDVIAVDGTKVHANASQHANSDYERIAREILDEAAETDRLEDEQFGDRRGDELPPELSTAQGRRGWLRDAKRRLDERRAEEARAIPASRPARLKEAKRRLEEELWTECEANAAYEAYRARGRMKDGRRFGAAGPLSAARHAGGCDQRDRSGLAQREDLSRLGAGLQRASRRHCRADRHRGGRDGRLAGLRAPGADGHGRPGRARECWDRHVAEGRARRRRLLAPSSDGGDRRSRHAGPDPARRRQAQRLASGLGWRSLRVHAARP